MEDELNMRLVFEEGDVISVSDCCWIFTVWPNAPDPAAPLSHQIISTTCVIYKPMLSLRHIKAACGGKSDGHITNGNLQWEPTLGNCVTGHNRPHKDHSCVL